MTSVCVFGSVNDSMGFRKKNIHTHTRVKDYISF